MTDIKSLFLCHICSPHIHHTCQECYDILLIFLAASEYYSLYPNPVIIPSRNRSQSVVLSISDVNMLEQSETFTITTNVSITYGNDVQEGNFSFTIIDPGNKYEVFSYDLHVL